MTYNREHTRQALGRVAIVIPDARWPENFLCEKRRLRAFLGRIADDLQHYGSTAVPGLCAKPIIDMMAPVASLEYADELGRDLAGVGYSKIDAGFFKRRFFRRKAEGEDIAYHLHLVVSPLWPVKNELLLRDWLIQHPDVARTYQELKIKLALEFGDDMPAYTEAKSTFLRKAVNDARLSGGLLPESDWDE